MLAFLAEDADRRVFCYANGDLRKDEQNDEILRFVEFWRKRTGHLPEELVFDSKLTTQANLNELNRMGVNFITLRRRSRKMLQEIHQIPLSAWRRIELEGIARAYRRPRILDEKIQLAEYDGPIRQLTITDLGHEEPTLLVTNQLRRSPARLIGRYAQRMIIENRIADGIDFFHRDALSSAVAMKVNCDPQLTLMASSLYRLLGGRVYRFNLAVQPAEGIQGDLADHPGLVPVAPPEELAVVGPVGVVPQQSVEPLDGVLGGHRDAHHQPPEVGPSGFVKVLAKRAKKATANGGDAADSIHAVVLPIRVV